jgi:N-carbamoyl-L-amino-acid hydrolase
MAIHLSAPASGRAVASTARPHTGVAGLAILSGWHAAGYRPRRMLFVRNQNGSHNPDEAMEMADYAIATRLLAAGVERLS